MNNHPFLINEEFIAYLPSLGKALGSIEDAVIAQWLWFRRDRSTDETVATAAEIADAIGMSESTLKKRLAKLKARHVLTARRLSAFNSTSVWTVHLDAIPTDVSPGQSREDQIGTPGGTDPVRSEGADLVTPERTNSARSLTKNRKNGSKNSGAPLVVVEPPVPSSTTTPDDHLEAAGLSARDRGRFREYLRTVKNARSADAVIMGAAKRGDLTAQVREWRASLDVTVDGDAEPVLCEHGQDVALGKHMCAQCDPDRQPRRSTVAAELEGDGAPMPEWLREQLRTGERQVSLGRVREGA